MAVIAALSLFAAVPAAAQAKKIITISGSTSVFPLETQLARAWIKTKKGKKYGFKILQGGSNVGISDVSKGRVSIGASSRDPAAGDPGGLVFTKIARDAICIITNNSNPLGNITQDTIKNIFVGPTFTNWSQVPGLRSPAASTRSGALPTSGTHDAFRNIFLGGTNQGSFVAAKASNGLVQQGVQSDDQASATSRWRSPAACTRVTYNGVACTLRNAAVVPVRRSAQLLLRHARSAGWWREEVRSAGCCTATRRTRSSASDWVPLH